MDRDSVPRSHRSLCRPARRGFTLIELLVVIGIIAILATATIPAIKNLSKSNDETQGVSLVRTMITAARGLAVQQHRITGVVFFEESSRYSAPVNGKQVAMQLIVEDFNQAQYAPPVSVAAISDALFMVPYSKARQYLPVGMKIATLTDNANSAQSFVDAAEFSADLSPARVILFDANGQLLTRNHLATDNPDVTMPNALDKTTPRTPGTYPMAMGDWKLLRPDGNLPNNTPPASGGNVPDATSNPGFFLYNHEDLMAQNFAPSNGAAISTWITQHASLILVNGNTGSVIVDKGNH